jgi:hypothetical protein
VTRNEDGRVDVLDACIDLVDLGVNAMICKIVFAQKIGENLAILSRKVGTWARKFKATLAFK